MCTTLGYAKRTNGILESAVGDPEDGEVPDIESLPRGVITTVKQPRYLLVRVKGKLIPIGTCHGKITGRKKQNNPHLNKSKRKEHRTMVFRKHPVDLLYAVTYHKLQGLTLNKLILTINKHPNPLLRLVLSSLYVGISRVHSLSELRVLPYTDEDVDYLVKMKFDDLLPAWMNNYTKGRWKYGGFKNFEQKMLQKTQLDLGLVDNLRLLTTQECRNYLTKLDIIATGSKVDDLRSALKESYSQGRDLLNAGNGRLLHRQRINLYKQLKKLGDYNKLTVSRLRFFAKRLGIAKCARMRKQIIISALLKFEANYKTEIGSVTILALLKLESNNRKEIGSGGKANLLDVVSAPRSLRKRRPLSVRAIPPHGGIVRKKPRGPVFADISGNNLDEKLQRVRLKGLANLGNTCYFNSVVQIMLHCPLIRRAIVTAPQSIPAIREIHNLFIRMTNDDFESVISPHECFNVAKNLPQCRAINLSLGKRQEDAHEFFLKLLEHFDKELTIFADVYNLPNVFNIKIRSKTTCRECSRTHEEKDYLWVLSLPFPLGFAQHPANRQNLYSLLDSYFHTEIVLDHRCEDCGTLGNTAKKIEILNTSQLLVIQLGRFDMQYQKIDHFVQYPIQLRSCHISHSDGRPYSWDLIGFIVHAGPSIRQGHYFAVFQSEGIWYRADDTNIEPVSRLRVLSLKPYILFYQFSP